MKTASILAFLCGVACVGFAATSDLADLVQMADSVALFQVDPGVARRVDEHGDPTAEERKLERVYSHCVIRKIAHADKAAIELMGRALLKASADIQEAPPELAFEPTIIVCVHQKQVHLDLLLDFKAGNAYVYRPKDVSDISGTTRQEQYVAIGRAGEEELLALLLRAGEVPNQSLEPTPTAVTPRADARVAPAVSVAHH